MDNRNTSRPLRLLTAFILLLCYLPLAVATQQDSFVSGAPTPDWIMPVAIPQGYEVPHNTIQNGTYYLLVDEQIRIDKQREVSVFARYVTEIVNQKGMEFNSQIDIEFDPLYQQVKLHRLQVIRGDKVLDKLPEMAFSLLHNEDELSSQLYNGTRTLHGIIPDLRTGDILDYSYSILGENPVFSGEYSQWHTLQWSIPVEHLSVSYLVDTSAPLYHSFINLDAKLSQQDQGQNTLYSYTQSRLPAIKTDADRPDWHAAKSHLLVSTSQSWQQVADWGLELFSPSIATESAAINALAEQIKGSTQDKAGQIMAAIQFVQNEIRYFGIELGQSSHRPSLAQDTLARRFGDCKDKSVLLIALLRKLGVEAHPVLVDSQGLAVLNEVVPGASWFDHAIVKVSYQDKDYWVDATREMQFGGLEDIYQKRFGYGLVLKAGETALQSINPPPIGEIISTDTFKLQGGRETVTQVTADIVFTGFNADYQRNRLANNAIVDVQKKYLDHYQHYYNNLLPVSDMVIKDDQQANVVSYSLNYEIPDFWEENDKDFQVDFYSQAVNYMLSEPDDTHRQHPLALDYPEKITQHINIYLHDVDWSFNAKDETVSNDYFTYVYKVDYDEAQKLLSLTYSMEYHQDHVPAEGMETYLKDLATARDFKNYGIIEYKKDTSDAQLSENTSDSTSNSANKEPTPMQKLWAESGNVITAVAAWTALLMLYIKWRDKHHQQQPYTGEARFYAVSKTKFLVLTLLTCGMYFYYWFYINYQFEKARYRPKVMPFWRSLFHIFFYYPLFRTLTTRLDSDAAEASEQENEERETVVPDYAVVLAILFLAAPVVSNVMEIWYTQVIVLTGIIMLPMLHMIKKANVDNESLAYNSRWHPRHLLLVPMFAPLFLYLLAYDLALLPATKVVDGNSLYSHDINFMVENDVIAEDETIVWFYSDAEYLIRNDGNGVTSNSIFSYYRDDEDALVIDRANYDEIESIKVDWSDEDWGTTFIDVVTVSGEEFVLYVSNEDGLDKTFVQYLNRRLKQYR